MAFEPFDARAPFNARHYVAECHNDDHTRAMFYDLIRRAYERRDVPAPDFPRIPFSKAERRTYNAALIQSCEVLFPEIPLGLALFDLGRDLYPHFASTMVGKAIFSVAGRDFPSIVRLAPRAYTVCNGYGTIEVLEASPGKVVARFEDVWDPLPFTCGIWQGGLDVCDLEAKTFELDVRGPVSYDLRITY